MSRNQPRGERSESTQYKKTDRSGSSNQQRNFPAGVPTKGGGGGASSATSNPANRGPKKYTNIAQGGQLRARSPNVDSDSGANSVQNGPHQEQPAHKVTDATVTSTTYGIKLIDAQTQKNTQAAVRASSNVPPAAPISNSPSGAPTTPAKGDPAKSFPLQFGSISPGFLNGVQIPARTSSAPPNLDEQKKAQAHQESSRAAPALPIPSIPKQYPPSKKDAGIPDQTNTGQAPPIPKSKRGPQVPATPSVTQTQKPSVHPIPGMPMQMPFHQQQVPVQFGGSNPQIQSQAMSGTSLPLPMQMPLPMGNPSMQQPMFISGLQPHPMQSQGMLHQVQNLNFSTQMGHQLPPQLGSMGVNVGPQFPQQQSYKYGSSRKSVKITHPETHEELRLDGAPGARSHPNVPPQSQPIPSFPPNHPMNFYPNSYCVSPIYYPAASSVSMNSSQVPPTSQPLRSYNQVSVKPPIVSHVTREQFPASNSNSVGKAESSEPFKLCREDSSSHQKEVVTSSSRLLPQSKSGLGAASTPAVSLGSINMERDVCSTTSASMISPVSTLMSSADGARNEVLPESMDKHSKSDNRNQQDQDGKQSTSPLSVTSQLSEAEVWKTKSASQTNLLSEVAKESSSTIPTTSEGSNLISKVTAEQKTDDGSVILSTKGVNDCLVEPENVEIGKEEALISEWVEHDKDSLEASMQPLSLKSLDITDKSEQSLVNRTGQKPEEPLGSCPDDVQRIDALLASTQIDSGDVENSKSANCSSSHDDKTSSLRVDDAIENRDTIVIKSALVEQDSTPNSVPSPHDVTLKHENEDTNNNGGSLVTHSLSSIKDKVSSDANVVKTAAPKTKKKRKELYRKAEAAGTSSDLYNAYKGPEEKKESVSSRESLEKDSNENMNVTSTEMYQETHVSGEKPAVGKVEPDDWEDAAEISPQLGTRNDNHGNEGDGIGLMTKKRYSRDFLLKFVDQCMDLPDGFEIPPDIADIFTGSRTNILREHRSPGRNIDRPVGNSRVDRRSSGLVDDDKWSKMAPGALLQGHGDMWTDVGYGGNMVGFRPNQGGNFGVLRNPRAQTPVQYAGGILSGPMQPLGPQGGLQRNYSDMDRWQRGTGYQRGLMPSPQTPPPVMHRAEKKYEVGKVTDEEQAKQRQLKGILNKLTPQNFEKLFEQVKHVNIDNVVTLSGVISQIFDKALMEPTFCQMYADFCFHLAADLPDLSVDSKKITFKRLLLNKCQEEFERGEREEEEANKAEEGDVKQTAEEREEKRLKARRRMLGNIRLIGELYKKRMLTERIMHECINKLLGQYQNPDEENIEALCKLMSTIGEMIDHPKAKDFMDAYFDIMTQLSNNMKLSSRVRFMLKDSIDLRKNKWQERRKVEGPKKIEEVHRDAAQERQAHSGRMTRVPSMGNSVRRGPSMDFAPRTPSMLSSPGSNMGSFRAAPPHLRGIGSQDVRTDDRPSFENRTMPLPLPQRHAGDDYITLGPQGGLVRGMGFRGQPSLPSTHLAEISSPADARTMGPSLNGFSPMPERTPHGQREDVMPRCMPDRLDAPSSYDRLHSPEQSATYVNREAKVSDRGFDRSPSMPPRGDPPTSRQNVSSEKESSEEQLRDKSVAAITEFYSARDKQEVALCVKELNSPSFYPTMISIWIADSFERKDMERDLLTKLLLSLAKPHDGLISKDQLIRGFESVLAILEDAVNDAPKAPEFLGCIFARVILENIILLSETAHLILEGGEEPGSLVEAGLAADIMACILDVIKSAKGDSAFNEILSGSNLQLEKFRPPGSIRFSKIDKFIV